MKLTKRELEVVAVLVEGLSNKEIARRLSITDGTVKIHLNTIYQKLGIFSRTKLMAHFHELPRPTVAGSRQESREEAPPKPGVKR